MEDGADFVREFAVDFYGVALGLVAGFVAGVDDDVFV